MGVRDFTVGLVLATFGIKKNFSRVMVFCYKDIRIGVFKQGYSKKLRFYFFLNLPARKEKFNFFSFDFSRSQVIHRA